MVKVKWDFIKEEQIEKMVSLWNKELGDTYPMRKALFYQNSVKDENVFVDGSLLLMDEQDEVIGFIVSKYPQTNRAKKLLPGNGQVGWIQTLIIAPLYRQKGYGEHLLQHAEKKLMNLGVTKINIGRDPFHYFPGVPSRYPCVQRWFEKRDYLHTGTVSDYHRDLKENPVQKRRDPSNLKIRTIEMEELKVLLEFMEHSFHGRWEYEACIYADAGGTGREYVVVFDEKDEMIGFCRVNDRASTIIGQNEQWSNYFEDPVGGIGPLGVISEYRGRGYGQEVVQAAIEELETRGVRHLIIDWTVLDSFYRKFEFEPIWTYQQLQKQVEV
ncbi:GNAT family N-acetyltransferase [Halalkalibacillus halophilus]|uniref:GNAT family N-acetyltransferase n=1 Tax=Halalkalibacillus halophilus TaxID=392827 RepID=UPI0004054AC7|nr:GNAT family N-acetyltransferase [Halalkalibacillus halophilus]